MQIMYLVSRPLPLGPGANDLEIFEWSSPLSVIFLFFFNVLEFLLVWLLMALLALLILFTFSPATFIFLNDLKFGFLTLAYSFSFWWNLQHLFIQSSKTLLSFLRGICWPWVLYNWSLKNFHILDVALHNNSCSQSSHPSCRRWF